ncbi:19914_t:CDS:2, partial [Gigaspora margarita]
KFVIHGQEAFLLNQKHKDNEYENSKSGESSFKPLSKEILKKKSDDKKHERTNWNPEWPNQFPWEDHHIVDRKPLLFCIWCEKYSTADNIFVKGCSTFRKDYFKQYIKINNHINAMKAFNQLANQTDLFTGFSVQADHNKLEIISKISLNYAEYNNSVSGTTFLHAIATVIEKLVLEETRKSSAWSLLIDESNMITHDKTCAIVSKHIANNIPVLQYLGLIELKEIDTIGIMDNLNIFFLAKMLEPSKLLHFGSDGDKVRNGVSAKLKKLNPFMSNCYCIAYRLALAGKDSAKDVPYFLDYEFTIKEIYAYFANSYSRWQNLQLFQAQDEESPELAILQVVSTRWLSLSNAVSNLHQINFSVIDALQEDAINNSTAKSKLRAQNLLEELDVDFILATKFLADILSIISALCKIFQSDYVALSDIHQELTKTINLITIEFIGYPDENIEPTLGTHLHNYCIQYSVNIVPNFVKEFANAMINNLQAQFSNIALYNAMRIFDFKQVPSTMQQMSTFGEEDIAYIAEYYRVDRLENGWEFIFCTTQFITQYPNLAQVIHLALIVPVSNGHLHNQMQINTLNSHLMIVMNGPSLDKFDFEKAYDLWKRCPRKK